MPCSTAHEQREHEKCGIDAVEPKMHLVAGPQSNGEHRRDCEADGGERRAKAHIHRPLQLIGERRVEGGQALRREHKGGNENATERRGGAEMLDAEIDYDSKVGGQRHDRRKREQQHEHVIPEWPEWPCLVGDEMRHGLSLA